MATTLLDSFGSRSTLDVGGRTVRISRLDALAKAGVGDVATLPHSLKVLLENLLRHEDGKSVTREDIAAVASWDPRARPAQEIAFRPARILLQDFTGVPAVVDLAAMREAFARMGGDPARINPLLPADLVIDHSVQVDEFGSPRAFAVNAKLEMERNQERYQLLRWGQRAFSNFRVVPPDTGIVHQINLEYLARVVFLKEEGTEEAAYPDTLLGTDSHTTMVNGLGVVGWGVGGIEAEAAMLGQPVNMLLPQVVGFRLTGRLAEGATATDLVLTVTQMLRSKGVVGKFVEFCGDGIASLSLPDRATIANMAPEYGATIGYFPIDEETLAYLRFTGRDDRHVALVEAYAKAQGLFHSKGAPVPRFTDTLELDLSTVEPCLAGPKRPQDRVPLTKMKRTWRHALLDMLGEGSDEEARRLVIERWLGEGGSPAKPPEELQHHEKHLGKIIARCKVRAADAEHEIGHGAVVIAAITSCTNTSNPAVLVAAGLLARKAVERGLRTKPWVKTSLAPGSQVVTEYLTKAELMAPLETLGFHLVGYGCTTCIGNSGPLPDAVAHAVRDNEIVAAAVLSGNRNFEGRINPLVRANWLASPPLVVAYALAGTVDFDPQEEPLGHDPQGRPVFLRDVWPTQAEVRETMRSCVESGMFRKVYANVLEGTAEWRALDVPDGDTFRWEPASTYVRSPPFFDEVAAGRRPVRGDIRGARVLAMLGDSVTTDHISPAGNIKADGPAGRYLVEHGVAPADFNSYGARRGNHEVMVRGTFANIRLRNLLAPGTEGGVTRHLPTGEVLSIFDASQRYQQAGVPLVVFAGKEYGSGSSRDWAAKGPYLLGISAVIAESYERIHRSNLVGMGVLPLQFMDGQDRASLGLDGEETYAIEGLSGEIRPGQVLKVRATSPGAPDREFEVVSRIDTLVEVDYYRDGGILPYVLRQMAGA
jgi:aconitate hydratase